jgi:hypothetical protein
MDESLHELESELKSLRPQRPAPGLLHRLERDLAAPGDGSATPARPRYTSATNLNSGKWLGWRAVGIAVALALVATLGWMNWRGKAMPASDIPAEQLAGNGLLVPPPRTFPTGSDRYQPVAATNVLYDLKDEGPVKVDGDAPAHRLRYRYLDTYTWKNPRNNASLKWSVPRDEIRVLPASLN